MPFKQLVLEVEKSLNRVKSMVALAAAHHLEKMPENQSQVISSLVSLIAVNRQSVVQTLQTLLESVTSVVRKNLVPSNHSLSHGLVTYFSAHHFLMRTISDMFLSHQPLFLPSYIDRKFPHVDCSIIPDDDEVRSRLNVWCKQQAKFLAEVLPKFLQNLGASDVLLAVKDVSQFFTHDRQSEWDQNAVLLVDGGLSAWTNVLKGHLMPVIRSLISRKVTDVTSVLTISSIANASVNISTFVWVTSSDSETFPLKRFALIPELMSVMEKFQQKVRRLKEELELLFQADTKLTIVAAEDLKTLKSSAAEAFDTEFEILINSLVQLTKSQSSQVLASCFLLRGIVMFPSDLKSVYRIHPIGNQWFNMREKLIRQSHVWLSAYFNRRIEQFNAQLSRVSELSVDHLSESSVQWEEIVLQSTEESDVASVIRVPVYPSICYMDFLTLISREVNQIAGFGVSDEVSIAILLKASMDIIRWYKDALKTISSSHLPSSVLQRKSLQSYFDLLVSKSILTPIPSDQIRSSLIPKLSALISAFEEKIDPFDLHLMSGTLQKNALAFIRNSSHTLCLFVPEIVLESAKKSVDPKSANSVGNENLRPKASCPALPLLPLKK